MKLENAHIGTLVCKRDGSFWGEIVDINSHGHVTVLSYFDDCHHYINLQRLIEPKTRKSLGYGIEPDNGQYHGYIRFFKGCHTAGNTEGETHNNLRDCIHAYIRTMRKYGEVQLHKSRWDSWYYIKEG
jgi:predicted RNase H-like HicB family nuclease